MSAPRLLEVPVMADNWREARKDAIERMHRLEAFRDRRILRTHTEQMTVWWPSGFKTWSVTIEFAEEEG